MNSLLQKRIFLASAMLFVATFCMARTSQPNRLTAQHLDDADPEAKKCLSAYDVGLIRGTLSNWGEYGNPDGVPGFKGFEYPINSGNDFLFSAGIWIGAEVNNQLWVSTGTDGDNGTNEFYPVHIGAVPQENSSPSFGDWWFQSNDFQVHEGWFNHPWSYYVEGVYGADDDGDWNLQTDDLNYDLRPSRNWDGGGGILAFDDDQDGLIDEESTDGNDNDGDGLVDEDTQDGDTNGDRDASYDSEPHIDEDPAGNVATDNLDNDHDGLVDAADSDADGDCCPVSLDDDGDGQYDEDAAARAPQEFRCVYHDSISTQYVGSPDPGDPHDPLDVIVSQRSYVWSSDLGRNIVLVEYTVRNKGIQLLENVHLAFFADADIGAAGEGGDAASLDDSTYYDSQRQMMVTTDDNTDNDGPGPGVFGVRVVKPPIPWHDAQFTYANFERVSGGDPPVDTDKFAMISTGNIDPASPSYGDWRMLMGWGSVDGSLTLAPGEVLDFTVAMIGAANIAELNAIADRLPVFDAGPIIGNVTLYTSPQSLGPYILSAPFNDYDGIAYDGGVQVNWFWLGHETVWNSAPQYSYVWTDPETYSGEYYFVLPDTHANGSENAVGDTIVFYTSGEDGFGNYSAHTMYTLIAGTQFLKTDDQYLLSENFQLEQNFPNPFNSSTEIHFDLPQARYVVLTVFDITGREVAKLKDEIMSAGAHTVAFDAGGLPSGIYVYRMESGGQMLARKMALLN